MNHDSIPDLCPRCGVPVPTEAPAGLCPKCLMVQVAMSTGGDGLSAEAKTPPSLEEVAAAFPQLEVLEMVGQGGMGVVFKARQPKLDRLVALKILPERLARDPTFAERFTREGQMLARLGHPNVVGVYDFGESGGFFYLLMEYVDGVNLRQALQSGRFAADQALAIVPKICEALQYAHEQGVLHRDIKPENILLDTKGRVKIADFGIAKFAGDAEGTGLTASGAALGTPHYVAPEQIEHPSEVDHRADIYSLGVVFYEMLTGELPLGRFAPPSEKSSVDARVDEVVLRALEKERERRQQSASEVRTQVETLSAAVPPKPKENGRTARLVTGRWLALGLLLGVPVVALLILLGGALLLYLSLRTGHPTGHFRHTNLRLDEETFKFDYTCEAPEGWKIVVKTREYGEWRAVDEFAPLLRENVTPLDAAGEFRLDVSHLRLAGEDLYRAQASIGPPDGWPCRLRPHEGFALMHVTTPQGHDRIEVVVTMQRSGTAPILGEALRSENGTVPPTPATVDVPDRRPKSTSPSPNPVRPVDAENAVGKLQGVSVVVKQQRTIVFRFTLSRPPGTIFSAGDAGSRANYFRTLEIHEVSEEDSNNGPPIQEVAWELPGWSQIERHVPDVLTHVRKTFIDKQVTMAVGERKDIFAIQLVNDNGFESNFRGYFELSGDPLKPRPGVRLLPEAERLFAWGEAANGLRAGILPPQDDFLGERCITAWTLAVQNVGRRPVEITTSAHPLFDRRSPLVDGATSPPGSSSVILPSQLPTDGETDESAVRSSAAKQPTDAATPEAKSIAKLVVAFSEPREIERRLVRRYRLAASEAVILSSPNVMFGKRDKYDWKFSAGRDLIPASPGDKLTIGYTLGFPEVTCQNESGKPFVAPGNEWHGRLGTGVFPLRLLASEDATRERLAQQGQASVSGRVEDHQGSRLAGVSVAVEMGANDLELVGETVTDRSGNFRIRIPAVDADAVVQGVYVTPRLPGYFPVDLASTGKTIAVRPESEREKQIAKASRKGRGHLTLTMQPAARFRGRLLGQDGQPLAKQVVAMEGDSPFSTNRYRSRPRAVTDSEGYFDFPELAAGVVRHLVTEFEGMRYHGPSFKLSPAQTRHAQVTVDRPGTATLLLRNVDGKAGTTVREETKGP